MKWSFGVKQKVKIALLLGGTFLLLFLKNVWDRMQVKELGDSFTSVYEDRLVVEGYIFSMADMLHLKKSQIEACGQTTFVSGLSETNGRFKLLLDQYEHTKLTAAEALLLSQLKQALSDIEHIEQSYLREPGNTARAMELRRHLQHAYIAAGSQLHGLSSIQLAEAKSMNEASKKMISGSALLTELEFALFIVVGLLLQLLLFASGRAQQPNFTRAELN